VAQIQGRGGDVHRNVQGSIDDAKAFVAEFDVTYPIVRDTDLKLWNRFGVRGVPETFFVDREYRFVAIAGTDSEERRGGSRMLGAISPAVLTSRSGRCSAPVAILPAPDELTVVTIRS
jgi:hypothetical protein